jgi:hypothetical protein
MILSEKQIEMYNNCTFLNEGLFLKPNSVSRSEFQKMKNVVPKVISDIYDELAKMVNDDKYAKKLEKYKHDSVYEFNKIYTKINEKGKGYLAIQIKGLPNSFVIDYDLIHNDTYDNIMKKLIVNKYQNRLPKFMEIYYDSYNTALSIRANGKIILE